MPGLHFFSETGIEHIAENIVAVTEFRTLPVREHFRTQERRNHLYLAVIRHWPERKGQKFGSAGRYRLGKQVQGMMALITEFRNMHILVQKKELVPYARHRNSSACESMRNRTEQLIKIQYHIRAAFLDFRADQ